MTSSRRETIRAGLRLLLAAAFGMAGALHVVRPAPFLAITPVWVPQPDLVILITGLCELAGAAALLLPRLRWWAGVMLTLYAFCVFPANVHHALAHVAVGPARPLGWGYHAPRLAFQPVIIWWCLFAGGIVDWPWRSGGLRER